MQSSPDRKQAGTLTRVWHAAPAVAADQRSLLTTQPQALKGITDAAVAIVPNEASDEELDIHGNASNSQPAVKAAATAARRFNW